MKRGSSTASCRPRVTAGQDGGSRGRSWIESMEHQLDLSRWPCSDQVVCYTASHSSPAAPPPHTAPAPPPAAPALRGRMLPACGLPAWQTAAPRGWQSSPAQGPAVQGAQGRRRSADGRSTARRLSLCSYAVSSMMVASSLPPLSRSEAVPSRILDHMQGSTCPLSLPAISSVSPLTLSTGKERWKKPTAVMAKKQRWCTSSSQFLQAQWHGHGQIGRVACFVARLFSMHSQLDGRSAAR